MELKIGSQELARALGRSQGIVERKSTMPILSHVLLEARKGTELHLSATDLDLSVTSQHACEVAKDGAVAVSAKHLYEIVRALPEQTRHAEAGRQQLPRGQERPLRVPHRRPAGRGLPGAAALREAGLRRRRPEVTARPDRADLLRRLQRRDPLQPERRLLRAAGAGAAAGGHRRPPPGGLGAAAGRRLRPQEGRHPAEEGAAGAPQAAHRGGRVRRGEAGGPARLRRELAPSSAAPASPW